MLYGALSAALLVMIAALTVTASRNGPPLIAEYAPTAVQQIKDAPLEQSSSVGSGEGGPGGEGSPTTTTTAPPVDANGRPVTTTTTPKIERARVLRCVGNPLRQTEDPQSPPCIAFWDGTDNGGATYPGVDATTIKVAVPTTDNRALGDLEAYFNSRYQFYGRKLKLVQSSAQSTSTCQERAAGAQQDVAAGAFAATGANDGNAGNCYNDEMARAQRISVAVSGQFDEPRMAATRPYLWQYTMSNDEIFSTIGEQICARFAGKPANHTTDPTLRGNPRSFGVILENVIRRDDVSLQPLFDSMAKCGAKISPDHVFRLSSKDDAGLDHPEAAQTAVVRLKADHVTTVINLGIVFVEQYIANSADQQNYFPEWIFSTYGANDLNTALLGFWTPTQRTTVMGFTAMNPMRPYAQEPAIEAIKEVDPTIDMNGDSGTVGQFFTQYKPMLLLASGIQMAGPHLTPQTFEQALQRTVFPYPADDPTQSGNVGFHGDHSMTDDIAEFWWSETDREPVGIQSPGGTGTLCYVRRAARVLPNTRSWPTDDPFFQRPCYPGPS
jgi:hypothetical protein